MAALVTPLLRFHRIADVLSHCRYALLQSACNTCGNLAAVASVSNAVRASNVAGPGVCHDSIRLKGARLVEQ